MGGPKEIVEERLTVAERELAELEERRKLLTWRVREYRELLGQFNQVSSNGLDSKVNAANDSARLPPSVPFTNMSALQTIAEILRKRGTATRIVDLAKLAIAGGYGGGNAHIAKVVPNFSSALSRDMKSGNSRFVKLRRGIFDLKDRVETRTDKLDKLL